MTFFAPAVFAVAPLRVLALTGLFVLMAGNVAAQSETRAAPDAVVARVDGHEIRASDVQEALQQLPPEYTNMPVEALRNAVVEQLIDQHLVVKRARDQGLKDDPAVQSTMKQLETRVLEQTYLRRTVESKVTDEAVRRRYERDKDKLTRDKQVRARHILVKTREEAMDILREVSRGKDFAELAREKSIGPSKTQGGDLGYFAREAMLPAFSQMAFSLKKGEVGRAPVQTKYGWHVIKVEDIREAAPPPFEEARDELRSKMGEEIIDAEIKRLRQDAKVERFGADGKPAKAAPAPGDPAPAGGKP
ncbi:MAG: peptidylprolyl isomerase [Alphaproteobacteria bacterium]|nr:peptidylprolyl isomerase [Alphaproteobacteria bacterium]